MFLEDLWWLLENEQSTSNLRDHVDALLHLPTCNPSSFNYICQHKIQRQDSRKLDFEGFKHVAFSWYDNTSPSEIKSQSRMHHPKQPGGGGLYLLDGLLMSAEWQSISGWRLHAGLSLSEAPYLICSSSQTSKAKMGLWFGVIITENTVGFCRHICINYNTLHLHYPKEFTISPDPQNLSWWFLCKTAAFYTMQYSSSSFLATSK